MPSIIWATNCLSTVEIVNKVEPFFLCWGQSDYHYRISIGIGLYNKLLTDKFIVTKVRRAQKSKKPHYTLL